MMNSASQYVSSSAYNVFENRQTSSVLSEKYNMGDSFANDR